MKRKIFTVCLAACSFSMLAPAWQPSALGFFDQLRPWYGHQRPDDGGSRRGGRDDDYDPEAARQEAEEKAKDAQYDAYSNQEDAAIRNGNYQEALQLALQRQGLRDGPKVRSSIALYRGLIADQSGDYRTAISFLEDAASNPGYADYAKREINRLEGLIVDQQKRKEADTALQGLNGVANQPQSAPLVKGLNFIEGAGAFGSKTVQPVFGAAPPAPKGSGGTDTDSGDQLKSAEHHGGEAKQLLPPPDSLAVEPSSAEARKTFDTAGENRGHLDPPAVETPASSSPTPVIPPEMANDPVIKEGMQHLTQWSQQLQQANEEVKKAQDAVKEAQNPTAKAMAVVNLNLAKNKTSDLQTAVESAKKEIEKRKVYLAPFKVGGTPSAPQQGVPSQQPASSTPPPSTTPVSRQPGS